MKKNIITLSDSYKVSHHSLYHPGLDFMHSYFESRVGAKFNETVFFGLQYFLKEYLEGQVVTKEKIDQAEARLLPHMGVFERKAWEYILEKHGGRLPVRINAVPEGTVVPVSNVMMTIESTDPKCAWLVNYLETLLVQVWYPCTVATQSREMKKIILQYLEETGDPAGINFKLHDFGFRGVSSVESAALGGAAHLVNFMGTDTLAGIDMLMDYYNVTDMPGFSIVATEHSLMTMGGRDGEVAAMERLLDAYPKGLIACVSDSYDIGNACKNIWGKILRDKVLAREGTLVVRPDSGDPEVVVPQVLRDLEEAFGAEKNAKGFKVLNPKVRVIQGDGIDFKSLGTILRRVRDAGFSADNVAFGSGGGLLQKLNRDTQRFAFKCSAARINGEMKDVFKEPATDLTKKSKMGMLKLVKYDNGEYATVRRDTDMDNALGNQLDMVFENGNVIRAGLNRYGFEAIRRRAAL